MIASEFLKIKTEKKWKICKCQKVIFHLEKINQVRAKRVKMEKILEQLLLILWARHFKNKENCTTKSSRKSRIDWKLRFQKISQRITFLTVLNKVRRIWLQAQKKRKLVLSCLRQVWQWRLAHIWDKTTQVRIFSLVNFSVILLEMSQKIT